MASTSTTAPRRVLHATRPFVLKPHEYKEFVGIISNIQTPSNYVDSIYNCLEDGKLHYMKTHDYHVLTQQILLVAGQNLLNEHVRLAIIKMSRVFQRLCAKEVRVADHDDMMRDVIMATCVLEKEFLTKFFNIMTHLSVHLVEQLFKCSPVQCRWMYLIERYMKTLKDYVRTLSHPEGSMAEGCQMDDILGFCTEYMRQYKRKLHRIWDPKEEPIMTDEILSSNLQRKLKMPDEFRNYVHAFVLDNVVCLEEWRE